MKKSLADQLADATLKHEAVISKANAKFAEAREEIIAAAHEKIDNIVLMREELAAEQAELEGVLADARAAAV